MIVERVNDGRGLGIMAGPFCVIVNGPIYVFSIQLRPLFDLAFWEKRAM